MPTRLQALLGISHPVIQAPMAGVQGSRLAVAVSNAGGLGSLPCAMLGLDAIRAELDTIRAQTDRPYNVNFFCHVPAPADAAREQRWRAALAPLYREFDLDPDKVPGGAGRAPFDDAIADLLDEFRPPVVSFHFGLPTAALLDRVRGWGSRILSSATTLEEALWLQDRGVDAIIAQGVEAGGHRGIFLSDDLSTQMGTFALVPQIVARVRVPVIAAGGIADSRGVAAALALGASGVQAGTAYLLCPEADTTAIHRAALAGEGARHTALTNVFTGRPARGIVNRLIREIGPLSPLAPAFPTAGAAIAPLRGRAESLGSGEFTPLWAGQNTSGCLAVTAAEITAGLCEGIGPRRAASPVHPLRSADSTLFMESPMTASTPPDITRITTRTGLAFDAWVGGPAGGDLVVMLHGYPQSRHTWREQLPALAAAGYRVVAPDQRGYSPGARPDPADLANYHYDRLVGDVIDIAAACGREQGRFHLVGHDWGGQVSWGVADRHADRLASLTILSRPHPSAFVRALANPDGDQKHRSRHHRAFLDAGTGPMLLADGARRLRRGLIEAGVPADAVELYVSVLGSAEAIEAALAWYRAQKELRVATGIITVPTLYVWGDADSSVSAAAAHGTAEFVSGPYRFVALPGVGHFSTDQQPQRVNELLLAHLAEHSV